MEKTIHLNTSENRNRNKWFDRDCFDKKKKARKALRTFQNSASVESKTNYKQKRTEYKETIREKKKAYRKNIQQNLHNFRKNSKKFWDTVKTARQRVKKQPVIEIQAWQEHFAKVLGNDSGEDSSSKINDNVNSENLTEELSVPLLDNPITENEVREAIKNLKSGKAGGLDSICSEFLKYACDVVVPFLTKLFNKLYDTGSFPAGWCKSVIIPIYKKGDDRNPDNYRGISLLSIVSKVFTSILNKRLYTWAEAEEKISCEQAGFRK
jgi:hypothetical protein